MAGLTSSSLFKPPLSCSKLSHSTHSPLLSFAESNLFGLRLSFPALSAAPSSKSDPFIHLSFSSSSSLLPISARYGGRSDDDDDDQALDLSSIRSDNVRLIDEQQNMVGVVSKSTAIQMAEDAELDLVVLSPDAEPPVVRIMDYDKFRYEQQKKKRDQQKKSAASRMDLKELKMGYNIDVHDYSVRLKAAKKFLQEGDKVKVIVNLKGRENAFRGIAIDLIKRFQNDVGELGIQESHNYKERNIYMVLIPNKALLQKGQESPKRKENSTVQSAGI